MKIQIDTEKKTIIVEEAMNLEELHTELIGMLPNWEEYTLEPKVITLNSCSPELFKLDIPLGIPTYPFKTIVMSKPSLTTTEKINASDSLGVTSLL